MKIEALINKHVGVMTLVGGLMATAISVTVFAYTNFATKEEVKSQASGIKESSEANLLRVERRLERIEEKVDRLVEHQTGGK